VIVSGGCLFCLGCAINHVRNRNITKHREWMSYMLACAFSPISMRLVYTPGVGGLGLDPREIFGICMLIGLVINLLLVRWWLSRRDYRASTT